MCNNKTVIVRLSVALIEASPLNYAIVSSKKVINNVIRIVLAMPNFLLKARSKYVAQNHFDDDDDDDDDDDKLILWNC